MSSTATPERKIPREKTLDSTVALLREAYEFIPRRARRYGSDVFETRLMLQPAICMTGAEAARVFYDDDRMTRLKAMPPTVLTLLQDKGSVALLDGAAHYHRKAMFLQLLGPGSFDRLVDLTAAEFATAATQWERRDAVVVLEAAQEVLCRAVCTWTGVPLEESEVHQRTRELAAMFHGAGSIGPRQWRGQALRARHERWVRQIIEDARAGRRTLPDGSPADVIARHRDSDGQPLDAAAAAVELINILRPTVAVAIYVTFAALALHEHPHAAERVRAGGDGELEQFAQEVRRFYPFFPLVGGRVVKPFTWNGVEFPEGRRVLLDLYGTNRDPRHWEGPDEFRPERFQDWPGDPYTLIPQGGGDHRTNHRCPGEWSTIALTKVAVAFFGSSIEYDVPEQDLRVDLSRMPAIPRSGFVIANVRAAGS
ncbi:cytochrome P450 [Thermoleophilum album]|uniref:Fatty-acid peroxygenase n=1 Tax=Thermoleophilum album TaxID=29539 RepID=A0A1H6FHY2_THEAL|nr:cytochrome P450 [Thermoleophilum album]SEH10449.1 fatty-acid peroxygenase [Thermoleophilum album]